MCDTMIGARTHPVDFALLDVIIRDGRIYPVAEEPSRRSIPFKLLTDYGADGVPKANPEWL
jgi:hypothetical protein